MSASTDSMHPTDDELVLHYYGEDGEAAGSTLEAHLAVCEPCRRAFQGLGDLLAVVASHADEAAPEGFERVMWARVRPAIEGPTRGRQRRWATTRWLALAGAAAVILVAAFALGRWSVPPATTPEPGTAVASVAPDRVWLAAVGDHLDRSGMVLAELLNAPPGHAVSAGERARATDLVAVSRLIRQAVASDDQAAVTDVLEELERVLIEIANGEEGSVAGLAALRTRIEDRGVLFRLRVVGAEVRERERGLRKAPSS